MTAEVGARLRDARQARGLSLRGVAEALGVSPSLISQVETGKTQPSVSTLYALVSHLGISMDTVLGVQAQPAQPGPVRSSAAVVQRAHDGPALEMEDGVRWERLASDEGGQVTPVLVTYQPGATSSVEGRMMRHTGVEYAYLLEGSLTLQLEFDTHLLEPGDSLQFDSERPHLYTNHGDVEARGIWFVIGR